MKQNISGDFQIGISVFLIGSNALTSSKIWRQFLIENLDMLLQIMLERIGNFQNNVNNGTRKEPTKKYERGILGYFFQVLFFIYLLINLFYPRK